MSEHSERIIGSGRSSLMTPGERSEAGVMSGHSERVIGVLA
jgi:hypothetical protein